MKPEKIIKNTMLGTFFEKEKVTDKRIKNSMLEISPVNDEEIVVLKDGYFTLKINKRRFRLLYTNGARVSILEADRKGDYVIEISVTDLRNIIEESKDHGRKKL